MNQTQLQDKLIELSGVNDFILELKPSYSKLFWGRYFIWRKIIRLYALDEHGNQYPDDILMREATHELVHHMQYYHIAGWEPTPKQPHDEQFYELHKAFLDKVFDREVPVKYSPVVERIVASRK